MKFNDNSFMAASREDRENFMDALDEIRNEPGPLFCHRDDGSDQGMENLREIFASKDQTDAHE